MTKRIRDLVDDPLDEIEFFVWIFVLFSMSPLIQLNFHVCGAYRQLSANRTAAWLTTPL